MNYRILLILPLLIFALKNCSTTKQGSGIGAEYEGGQYAFFGYQMQAKGGMAPDNCSIQFETTIAPIKSVDFKLNNKANYLYVPLEPRRYRVSRIKCGMSIYRVSNLFGMKGGTFTIHPGKVNYLGFSRLNFSKSLDLSFQWGQKASSDFLQNIYSTASESVKERMVNSYTGRSIKKLHVEETKGNQFFNVRYGAGVKVNTAGIKTTTEALKKRVNMCFKQEEAINPLRLGVLKYEVIYKNKNFVKAKTDVNSAYSKRLESCLATTFKTFKATSSTELEYVLDL